MPEVSLTVWVVGLAALVVGILAGHFGWGRHWTTNLSGRAGRGTQLDPHYIAGLDFLVTEQPDRALDIFLKLMDANADTVETHFALGALYRRRGEVERAIRIHQNLLAREALAPEHREQALLALAHDYLRAGLLDRAEGLLQQVSAVPRLRVSALDSLRELYERQLEWQQALDTYRQLARMKRAPPRRVAAHYLCEIATSAVDRGETQSALPLLREALGEVAAFPRALLLRSRIAERDLQMDTAIGLLRSALRDAPALLQEELPHLLRLAGPGARDALLADLVEWATACGPTELKRLVFAALTAGLADAVPLQRSIERVFVGDPILQRVWQSSEARGGGRIAGEIGALLEQADKYRCGECGFSGQHFYWHCPACHAWDSFEAYALVKLN